MKNKTFVGLLLGLVFLLMSYGQGLAWNDDDYTVHLRRNFGYGGGSSIRGTFTISLIGDESAVARVEFLMDGQSMAEIIEAPFSYKFQTDTYGFGVHTLSARVWLHDGSQLTTPALQYRFISPEDERQQVLTIAAGILGAIIGVMLLVGLIQDLMLKKSARGMPGQPRRYGMLGGTICPKCGRPFPRHIWGLNLLAGRLDRCEHCGKWVMTRRAELDALTAAEVDNEVDNGKMLSQLDSAALNENLEDSKYVDEI